MPDYKGAGQSWGVSKAQTERGRSDGMVEKPTNENVSLPSFPDLESLTSSDTHDSMPRLGIERESLDWSMFDDADDDPSGRENDILDENGSMVFL